MPRGVSKPAMPLPEKVKFEIIDGKAFIDVKAAAKLAGIHPAILEMGQRLLKTPGGAGAVFVLGTPEMVKRASDIEQMFCVGLKKVARAFGPGGLGVKSFLDRDHDRLVFWFDAGGPHKRKAAA